MITNLKIYDVSEALSNIPAIADMFPWGITNEKPLKRLNQVAVKPWMYVTKFEFWWDNNFTKRAHIEVSILWWPDMVADELEDMFIVIDNELLPDTDWCFQIKKLWNATITDIIQWSMSKAMRDAKENIIMRKTYDFIYITQN